MFAAGRWRSQATYFNIFPLWLALQTAEELPYSNRLKLLLVQEEVWW